MQNFACLYSPRAYRPLKMPNIGWGAIGRLFAAPMPGERVFLSLLSIIGSLKRIAYHTLPYIFHLQQKNNKVVQFDS